MLAKSSLIPLVKIVAIGFGIWLEKLNGNLHRFASMTRSYYWIGGVKALILDHLRKSDYRYVFQDSLKKLLLDNQTLQKDHISALNCLQKSKF